MILLSPSEQRLFFEDLLRFQIEELNGLGDRLRLSRERTDPNEKSLSEIVERCRAIVDTLSWNRAEVIGTLEHMIRAGPLERPEDAFAFALVFEALDPENAPFLRWVESLPVLSKNSWRELSQERQRMCGFDTLGRP